VLDFDHPSARDRLETLGRCTAGREDSASTPFAQRIRRLHEQLRFPATVRAAGVPLGQWDEARPEAIARALRSPAALANPRVASAPEVGLLLDAVVGP
jgi:alcohol dehydrogenase class IV